MVELASSSSRASRFVGNEMVKDPFGLFKKTEDLVIRLGFKSLEVVR